MVKKELVKAVAEKTGLDTATVSAVVESTMDTIKQAFVNDDPLFLRGFGSFGNKVRKAKPARNIRAKMTVIVPEHKEPFFRPCKELKNAVNTKSTTHE